MFNKVPLSRSMGSPRAFHVLLVKNPPANAGEHRRHGRDPWVVKIPWRRPWQLTPVFLPGKFHGQRSLAGCILWGCKELDTTDQLSSHTGKQKHT